jgi:hypothetical protein
MPVFRSCLPSASTSARMRSEVFADGLLDGRVTLVTGRAWAREVSDSVITIDGARDNRLDS